MVWVSVIKKNDNMCKIKFKKEGNVWNGTSCLARKVYTYPPFQKETFLYIMKPYR